jgi:hypothetical protein
MQTITVIGTRNSADFEKFLTKFTRVVNGWVFLIIIGLHLVAHTIEWGIKFSGVILIAYSATTSLWFLQSECREKKWKIEDNGAMSFGVAGFGLPLCAFIIHSSGLTMKPPLIILIALGWIIFHSLCIRIRGSMITWADNFDMRT